MKYDNLISFYLILILINELLIKYHKYVYSFIFTIFWVLVCIIILVKLKPKATNSRYKQAILFDFLSVKKTINVLLAIPILRLISISFPFKDYLYNLVVTYCIFGAIVSLYLINYKSNFVKIGHNFRKLIYLIPGIIIMAGIGYLNYKFLDNKQFLLNFNSLSIIIFSSYITVLYFQGLVQNSLNDIINQRLAIVYVSLISVILSLQTNNINIATTFLSYLTISYIFYKSRNLLIAFILLLTLNLLQYILLPLYGTLFL